jgi:Arc/MetJ-type ribon-helix-helix transcriptional regulator
MATSVAVPGDSPCALRDATWDLTEYPMKTIHLTEDLTCFLSEAVHSGRYANEDSVISDALIRLRQAINPSDTDSDQSAGPCEPAKQLTKQRFQQHLVEIGLLDPPGPTGSKSDTLDPSFVDDEEIVSEVVIRERLIEWLTGFLE